MLAGLTKLVQNDPLFEAIPSLEGIEALSPGATAASVYLGTGLCTPEFLSAGLPFDILSMVFAAEKIRRYLGDGSVFHLIADSHALSNRLFRPAEVTSLARVQREQLQRLATNLNFMQYHLILASELHNQSSYVQLLCTLPSTEEDHDYVRLEVTDIEWFRQHHEVCVKIGWIIQASPTSLKYDERLFDGRYRSLFDAPMSFLYVKAGRTFDPSRPKAPPYISIPGEKRLLLSEVEDVAAKLENAATDFHDKGLNGARRHFANLVRSYQELVEPLPTGTLEDKIAHIITVCTK